MKAVFNDPEVYANPFIFPLLSKLLQDRQIVESFGAVVSLPGAKEQRVHRDMFHLFEPIDGGEDILADMPPLCYHCDYPSGTSYKAKRKRLGYGWKVI